MADEQHEPKPINPDDLGPEPEPIPIDPDDLESAEEEEEEELEPLALEDDDGEDHSHLIQQFGAGLGAKTDKQYKRPLNLTGQGATRCKVFHSRIADGPITYMEEQINEWLDNNDVEVKYVSQTVGVWEGKKSEPNLIVSLWY